MPTKAFTWKLVYPTDGTTLFFIVLGDDLEDARSRFLQEYQQAESPEFSEDVRKIAAEAPVEHEIKNGTFGIHMFGGGVRPNSS